MKKIPNLFILDIDGVMTTGQFLYSKKGKEYKVFGAHDSDGLKMIKKNIKILFVTSDKGGFKISYQRITKDLGFKIIILDENKRYDYLKKKFGLKNFIYMGDGYYDAKILKECFFGICPKDARIEAKKSSNYITMSKSGEGAVLDACIKIKKKLLYNETQK